MQYVNHDYYVERKRNANMDEFSSLRLDLTDELESVGEASGDKQYHGDVQGQARTQLWISSGWSVYLPREVKRH